MHLDYTVSNEDDGQRAVDVLCKRCGMSRLMSKKIRLHGELTCNGVHHRMIDPVFTGDVLLAVYDPHNSHGGQLNTVSGVDFRYLDDWLLVASKPSGMVTHPTYLHEKGSLTSELANHPLHPVSRLDRDTSGLVLIARNGHAHHVLGSRPMEKVYVGLIHGRLPEKQGLIDAPIGRSDGSIMLREVRRDGSEAKTRWREIRYFDQSDVSFVRFELLTGRTHQIRVHCRYMKCPLIGDGLYGRLSDDANCSDDEIILDNMIKRQALHAASLTFIHPISGKRIKVTAKLPDDFQKLLTGLFNLQATND